MNGQGLGIHLYSAVDHKSFLCHSVMYLSVCLSGGLKSARLLMSSTALWAVWHRRCWRITWLTPMNLCRWECHWDWHSVTLTFYIADILAGSHVHIQFIYLYLKTILNECDLWHWLAVTHVSIAKFQFRAYKFGTLILKSKTNKNVYNLTSKIRLRDIFFLIYVQFKENELFFWEKSLQNWAKWLAIVENFN